MYVLNPSDLELQITSTKLAEYINEARIYPLGFATYATRSTLVLHTFEHNLEVVFCVCETDSISMMRRISEVINVRARADGLSKFFGMKMEADYFVLPSTASWATR